MAFSDLLKFGGKKPEHAGGAGGDVPASRGGDPTIASKALPKFVAALSQRESPLLIDFGPVIGANVAFFGEHLGCKLFIEDLAADLERYAKGTETGSLAEELTKRFPQADRSVDGVLCWDIFDFLDKATATALAREIVRVLRPGGAVMGFFCSSGADRAPFTKFEIADERGTMLRHRYHPGNGGPKYVLQNRDVIKMFDGLVVSDSFLLKSNTREMLLRRRA